MNSYLTKTIFVNGTHISPLRLLTIVSDNYCKNDF